MDIYISKNGHCYFRWYFVAGLLIQSGGFLKFYRFIVTISVRWKTSPWKRSNSTIAKSVTILRHENLIIWNILRLKSINHRYMWCQQKCQLLGFCPNPPNKSAIVAPTVTESIWLNEVCGGIQSNVRVMIWISRHITYFQPKSQNCVNRTPNLVKRIKFNNLKWYNYVMRY